MRPVGGLLLAVFAGFGAPAGAVEPSSMFGPPAPQAPAPTPRSSYTPFSAPQRALSATVSEGRMTLFAAASGRSVSLAPQDGFGDLRRLDWASGGDARTLTSDAQAGVTWRQGDIRTSIGYVHRQIQPIYAVSVPGGGGRGFGDSMVAISFNLHGH